MAKRTQGQNVPHMKHLVDFEAAHSYWNSLCVFIGSLRHGIRTILSICKNKVVELLEKVKV